MDDDETLLAASARGDADAFARFYRRHLGLVLGFGVRATGSRETAADLTGEVFAAALASAARYRAERETAAGWLIGIANNKLRESQRRGRVDDAVRRRLRIRPIELTDEDLERVDALASEGTSAVLKAFDELPALERAAVQARVLEERDYPQLAVELECSESVVRQRVSRGLARIRRRVGNPPAAEHRASQEDGS